jgi:hypothetical protein
MDSDDVEKSWHDPAALRAAGIYVVSVVVVAGLAFAATVIWHSLIAGILVPVILFVGGIGAFIKTYRVWRVHGTWPIWQGAGWILLGMFLFCLGVPVGVW